MGPQIVVLLGRAAEHRLAGLSAKSVRSLLPLFNIPLLLWTLKTIAVEAAKIEGGFSKVILLCSDEKTENDVKTFLSSEHVERLNLPLKLERIQFPNSEDNDEGSAELLLAAKSLLTTSPTTSCTIVISSDMPGPLPISDMIARQSLEKNAFIALMAPATPPPPPQKNAEPIAPAADEVHAVIGDVDRLLAIASAEEIMHGGKMQVPSKLLSSDAITRIESVYMQDMHCYCFDTGVLISGLEAFVEEHDLTSLRMDLIPLITALQTEEKPVKIFRFPKPQLASFASRILTPFQLRDRSLRLTTGQRAEIQKALGFEFLDAVDLITALPPKVKDCKDSICSELPADISVKKCVLGRAIKIGSKVNLQNSVILDGAVIGDNCSLQRCIVGEGVVVESGKYSDEVLAGEEEESNVIAEF